MGGVILGDPEGWPRGGPASEFSLAGPKGSAAVLLSLESFLTHKLCPYQPVTLPAHKA